MYSVSPNLARRVFVRYYLRSDADLTRVTPLTLSGSRRGRSQLVSCRCAPRSRLTHLLDDYQPVYISGRPFVLRDASEPRKMLSLSDRAENLEAIEDRLKHDILQEASK